MPIPQIERHSIATDKDPIAFHYGDVLQKIMEQNSTGGRELSPGRYECITTSLSPVSIRTCGGREIVLAPYRFTDLVSSAPSTLDWINQDRYRYYQRFGCDLTYDQKTKTVHVIHQNTELVIQTVGGRLLTREETTAMAAIILMGDSNLQRAKEAGFVAIEAPRKTGKPSGVFNLRTLAIPGGFLSNQKLPSLPEVYPDRLHILNPNDLSSPDLEPLIRKLQFEAVIGLVNPFP